MMDVPAEGDGHRRKALASAMSMAIEDLSTLIRQHIELARLEFAEMVKVRSRGLALMALTAVMVFFALAGLGVTIAAVLSLWLPVWAAALIVTVLYAVIAGGAFLAGRTAMKAEDAKPEAILRTLKEDATWGKTLMKR